MSKQLKKRKMMIGMTVGDVLRWSDIHQELLGEGTRVMHVKMLLEKQRKICRQIFINNVDWAEWAKSDEEAGELFDEAIGEYDK